MNNQTKFMCLAIEAPLQSWGTKASGNYRQTNGIPTRSGILGMISNAMRMYEKDEDAFLKKFIGLSQTCISYSENGELLIDFQVASPGDKDINGKSMCCTGTYQSVDRVKKPAFYHEGLKSDRGEDKYNKYDNIILIKEYIQSGKFAVILEVPEDLASEIEDALNCPKQPIYFGRKSCIPSRRIFNGTYDTKKDAEQAADDIYKDKDGKAIAPVFFVSEEVENYIKCDILTMTDVPVSFSGGRQYGARKLYKMNKV